MPMLYHLLRLSAVSHILVLTTCRPFVRSCLFQPVERGRLSKVMQQAATQASVTSLLENHAVVEIAAQAAISRQWDR